MAGLKKARKAAAKLAAQKAKQPPRYQTRVMEPTPAQIADTGQVANPWVMTTGDMGKP